MRTIKRLIVLCVVLAGQVWAGEIRGPYLTGLASDRATVVVHTSEDASLVLQYKEDDEGRVSSQESPKGQHHVFRLKDLRPGTGHTYEVRRDPRDGSSQAISGPWRFRTYPEEPGPFSFIVYGDSRESRPNSKRHQAVTSRFLSHDPLFVIHTGDVLTGGAAASTSMFGPDWTRNFFVPLSGVYETKPFLMVVGNHDQDSPEALDALRVAFPDFDGDFRYSFQVAGTRFIVLHIPSRMQEFEGEREWFERELLAAKEADWRIVLLHVSPFTNGKYRGSAWTLKGREDFLKECVRLGADLVLSGHDHSYQRFYPLKASENDTHAVHFLVTALAGTNAYQAEEDSYTARVVNRTDHFALVRVSPRELEITAYDSGNKPIDRTIIRKGEPTQSKVWTPVELQ